MNHETTPLLTAFHQWIELFRRRSMSNVQHFSKDHRLSMSQLGALLYIHRKGTSGVSEIGESLHVSGAAASQLLDRLVQQGLVARSESPRDRRVKHIVLTEKGQQMMHAINHIHQAWLTHVLNTLTPEEQAQVTATFTLLLEKAQALEE